MVANLKDQAQTWFLDSDGVYTRHMIDEQSLNAHTWFMTNPSLSGRGSALEKGRKPKRLMDNPD
jgi:polyphosphate kinase